MTREVAPVAILAGAKAWVKAADAPRFLQKLSAWLADRGWEKPPPGRDRGRPKKAAGSNGARRYGGKPDLARIAIAQGIAIREGRAL